MSYRGLVVRGSLLLMESLWIYALVALLVAITVSGDRPTFLGVAAVVFASYGISRALQSSDIPLGIMRIWGAMLSLLVFYAIVRADFYGDFLVWDFSFADALFNETQATLEDEANTIIAVPLLWLFWLRGVLRGQQSQGFDDVTRSFAMGAMVVAVTMLVAGWDEDMPREVDYVAVPYVAVGLLAIGLAHTSRAADNQQRDFTNVWWLVTGGAVGAMALVALLFVVVDLDTARDGLEIAGRGIGYVVAGIFYVALWPVVNGMELLVRSLTWIQDLWGGERNEPIENPVGPLGPLPEEDRDDSELPGWLSAIIRVVVGSGLIAAALIGVALLFRRFRKDEEVGAVRESVYQEGRLAADLGNLLGSVLGRWRPRGRTAAVEMEPVRRLYFDMVNTAAARGVERRPMETPLELEPRIGRTLGGPTQEITEMFDDVRYGAITPSPSELQRLREDWERRPK